MKSQLIDKLKSLKYEYRQDIRDRDGLEKNFREKFQALNRVQFGDADFERHLGEIITPDVFAAAKILRERNSFARDDGTPLNYTLVNIKDWCKNTFEVVNQLRSNTDNSHHRYDVILLNPQTHPQAKQDPAHRFAAWLASPEGQAAIGGYMIAGQRLFHPESDPKP